MAKELQRICILSGPSEEVDISRARAGIYYHAGLEVKVPFRILGGGPDLDHALINLKLLEDKAIEQEDYDERMRDLDHHLALYRFLTKETGEKIETVTSSVTLVQNVSHGFSEERDGRYGIVTEPWHYRKFKRVERSLKRKGRISQELEFFNILSQDLGYYSFVKKMASNIKTRLELMKMMKV